ncbi:hypothetical protein S83_027295 [Arachis hypogaea]|nr:uncharacterized protein DS421_9g253420 [Arachis hypogaea]
MIYRASSSAISHLPERHCLHLASVMADPPSAPPSFMVFLSSSLTLFLGEKARSRPPKLHVVKEKAKIPASSQPATTAKELASFMTFVPIPKLKRPRKKDKDV